MIAIKKLFDLVLTGSLKKVLLGAGLSLSSGAISFVVINYYINKLLNYISGMSGEFSNYMISLFGLSGLDIALNVIISAYVVKFTLKSPQVFLSKRV